MSWVRARALGLLFAALFLLSWIGQLIVQWFEYVDVAEAHDQSATFWSDGFWLSFWQSTLENWQSEFLQLASFVIAGAYLVYRGSGESRDGSDRIEAKLDALLRQQGLSPAEVESRLPAEVRRTA